MLGILTGIGIIASVAFSPRRDETLVKLESEYLFEMNATFVSVRRNHYLRSYAYRFIELCIPTLTESIIRAGVKPLIDAE